MITIEVKGLDAAELIAALYNATKSIGKAQARDLGRDITAAEVSKDLPEHTDPDGVVRFDYYHGRALKIGIVDGELLGSVLYDQDAGKGTCAKVIAAVQKAAGG